MTQTSLLQLNAIIASIVAWRPLPDETSAVGSVTTALVGKLPIKAFTSTVGQVWADLAEEAIVAAYDELQLPGEVEAQLMARFIVTMAAERPAASGIRAEVRLEHLVSMIALAQADHRGSIAETRAAIRETIVANAGYGELRLAAALRVIMNHLPALGLDYGPSDDREVRAMTIIAEAARLNAFLRLAFTLRWRSF